MKLLEREAWLEQLTKSADEEDAPALRKGVPDVVKKVDRATRTVDTVISTGTVDRDNDVIDPGKWSLKEYKKNPIFLWAHDHSLPALGSSTVSFEGGKLRSVDSFAEEGMHPMADLTFNLVAAKIIRAKSVGFRPQRGKFAFNDERGGYDFGGQELLEHSYVNVPSNPEALVGAKSLGIDLSPMIEWAEKILDDDDRIWLPRETVERALKIAAHERTVIPVNGFKLVPGAKDQKALVIVEVPLPTNELSVEDLTERLSDQIFTQVNNTITLAAEAKEPEPEPKDMEPTLGAMLDAIPAAPKSFTDEEVAFIGQEIGKSLAGTVKESVRRRLTALTGKLD